MLHLLLMNLGFAGGGVAVDVAGSYPALRKRQRRLVEMDFEPLKGRGKKLKRERRKRREKLKEPALELLQKPPEPSLIPKAIRVEPFELSYIELGEQYFLSPTEEAIIVLLLLWNEL